MAQNDAIEPAPTKIDDGGSAYPARCNGGHDKGGMSVRMWLAGQMAPVMYVSASSQTTMRELAERSLGFADALIAESRR